MKFSIITITLNSEKFLAQTLASVQNQTYQGYEHILWDGGSQDKTLEIAATFPHLKIKQGKDKGIADAMNLGAQYAQGDFLLFLHSDDLLCSPFSLQLVADFIDSNPNYDWFYGGCHMMNAGGETLRLVENKPYKASRLRIYNYLAHPSTFLRRQIFEQLGGFATSFKYCMDYDLWLRLSQKIEAISMPFAVSKFRMHMGSLSTNERKQTAQEAYLLRKKHVKNLWEQWRSYRTWKKNL